MVLIPFPVFSCAGPSSLLGLLSGCSSQASHCGGFSCGGARALGPPGPGATATERSSSVVRGLRCSETCGIFLVQGSNLCPLHWQADSLPPCHQGSLVSGL